MARLPTCGASNQIVEDLICCILVHGFPLCLEGLLVVVHFAFRLAFYSFLHVFRIL